VSSSLLIALHLMLDLVNALILKGLMHEINTSLILNNFIVNFYYLKKIRKNVLFIFTCLFCFPTVTKHYLIN
jgi:hypothetical protein